MKGIIACFMFIVLCLGSVNVWATDYFTLTGRKISESNLTASDKTILKFWTTWCPYCRKQLNYLKDKLSKLEKDGFSVHLVNVGENPQKAMKFIENLGIDPKYVVMDSSSLFARKHGVMGFPTYIFMYQGEELNRANVLNDKSYAQLMRIYGALENYNPEKNN